MSALRIIGVGYECPNCEKRIRTPHLGVGPDGPCYHFLSPYPEGKCCHFNEIIDVSPLEQMAVAVHSHKAAQ